MIGVLVCLTVSLTVFALVALANERWPDRLNRRARRLGGAGTPEASKPRRPRSLPPSPPRAHLTRLDRLHFGAL